MALSQRASELESKDLALLPSSSRHRHQFWKGFHCPIGCVTMAPMSSTIKLEIDQHIATVSLLVPTMPPVFFEQLRQAFADIAANPDVRAVILRSDAKSFSYGLDLPAAFSANAALFAGGGATERTALLALIRDLQDSLASVVRCKVPVIAAIHRHCIGGGIDLISCCDIRLATSDATFSVRETRIAIVADLGTLQRLPGIIGQGHTRELALTGSDIDATRAAEIALVNHVYQDQAELDEAANRMAKEIAANPPLTVRGVKDVLDFGRDHGAQAGMAYVGAWNAAFLASEDLGEAMAAFLQKRDPEFKGR